ncbi:hypothetical protein A2U01_0112350, partial [Trifolium medium]|nr:hypothetical protein [Trifolium medium]
WGSEPSDFCNNEWSYLLSEVSWTTEL